MIREILKNSCMSYTRKLLISVDRIQVTGIIYLDITPMWIKR